MAWGEQHKCLTVADWKGNMNMVPCDTLNPTTQFVFRSDSRLEYAGNRCVEMGGIGKHVFARQSGSWNGVSCIPGAQNQFWHWDQPNRALYVNWSVNGVTERRCMDYNPAQNGDRVYANICDGSETQKFDMPKLSFFRLPAPNTRIGDKDWNNPRCLKATNEFGKLVSQPCDGTQTTFTWDPQTKQLKHGDRCVEMAGHNKFVFLRPAGSWNGQSCIPGATNQQWYFGHSGHLRTELTVNGVKEVRCMAYAPNTHGNHIFALPCTQDGVDSEQSWRFIE